MKLTFLGAEPQLRIDTSVGTRVFAGETMIYGDTGWRDITHRYLDMATATGSILTLGDGAKILVKRTATSLSYGFEGPISASRNWTNLFQLPTGISPDLDLSALMPLGGRLERNGTWLRLFGIPIGEIAAAGKVSVVTFPMTTTTWPNTQLGTPR